MKILKYALPLLYIFLLLSCGKDKTEDKKVEKQPTTENKKSVPHPSTPVKTESKNDSTLQHTHDFSDSIITRLKEHITSVPFYFSYHDTTFFYTSTVNWKPLEEHSIPPYLRMGIVDSSGNTILPEEYERILSPNVTATNYIEIKKDGKYGLFHYPSQKVIACIYDAIYPSANPEFVAFGTLGKYLFGIFSDGTAQKINIGASEVLMRVLKKKELETKELQVKLYATIELADQRNSSFIYFTPSYVSTLSDLSPFFFYTIDQEYQIETGTKEMDIDIVTETKIKNDFWGFVTSYMEKGIGVRDYQVSEYHIKSRDNSNTILASRKIEGAEYYENYYCSSELRRPQFDIIHDTIVEVKHPIHPHQSYDHYDLMTHLEYYRFTPNGDILSLDRNRFFDMTYYRKITEKDFFGCNSIGIDEPEANRLVRNHLTKGDLDIMLKEIFAEYGYIFKSKKWQIITS
jgi:hypothetical protein